jgi:hypothetical protein
MPMIGGPLSLWKGGAPQGYRFMSDIVRDIGNLDCEEEQVEALRKSPKAVRDLCHFCYGAHEIDLPTGPLWFTPIDVDAFVTSPHIADHMPDEDLLCTEAPKLVKLFAVGVSSLTSKQRFRIFADICERVEPAAQELLHSIRCTRQLPGIPREVVEQAFPGLLNQTLEAPRSAQEPRYPGARWEGVLVDAPKTAPAVTTAPTRTPEYEALMRKIGC